MFEYWSHAASYMPMCNYRFSLPRKQALANGEQTHWYPRNDKLMKSVIKRIASEGPLMAKDFDDKKQKQKPEQKPADWKSKPSKQALETLFMQGDLMVSSRKNFHKVYDLTERVLPEGINTTLPNQQEQSRFLITQYLQANGIGQASEIAYLLKNTKPIVTTMLQEMASNDELLEIKIGVTADKQRYYALPKSLELLSKPLARSKLKILSPFDNLLIQRKRMKALFNFNYLIECMCPKLNANMDTFRYPFYGMGN